ncbi:hypothetical protein [Nitrospira lenta]|uniref:Uncharacterized protein n=1 Tax=Nitrospira lenta TaxID=1436998 RepID=A0A330L4T6_9BACT|nr:hypothetical protein [Nitrospira lenta]SPP64844.1 conserved exported hypothetical protein [Nitrospira lenta]
MRQLWLLSTLALTLFTPNISSASTSELGTIIESFIVHHFPDATSHIWIVNGTEWDGDEMVVDIRTMVLEKQMPAPVENRYLLLIREGKLAAAQRVPLEDGADCLREET